MSEQASASGIRVELQAGALAEHPPLATVTAWVAACAGHVAATPSGVVTVRLVGDAESADLNQRFRARSGPTNVLSFPSDTDWMAPGDDEPEIGDVVVCVPQVQPEAAAQDKTYEKHLAHIIVHGMMHLLGHDHMERIQAERMEAAERRVLAQFGIADPYVCASAGDAA